MSDEESQLARQRAQDYHILHAHDSKDAEGWYKGTVHSRTRDRDRSAARTNKYKAGENNSTNRVLNGCVSSELSAATYGSAAWWVVLERAGP